MTIAVEPMLNLGTDDVALSKEDGWTVTTKDQLYSKFLSRNPSMINNNTYVYYIIKNIKQKFQL